MKPVKKGGSSRYGVWCAGLLKQACKQWVRAEILSPVACTILKDDLMDVLMDFVLDDGTPVPGTQQNRQTYVQRRLSVGW